LIPEEKVERIPIKIQSFVSFKLDNDLELIPKFKRTKHSLIFNSIFNILKTFVITSAGNFLLVTMFLHISKKKSSEINSFYPDELVLSYIYMKHCRLKKQVIITLPNSNIPVSFFRTSFREFE
jgi:hypothetical protein